MDLSGSSEVSQADVSVSVTDTPKKAKAARPARDTDSKSVNPLVYPVEVDHSRDALLTDFGKDTLQDRYLLPGENFQDLFVRVASGLCRRCRPCAAALRLYLEALVHAGHARSLQWRHRPAACPSPAT